MAKKAMWLDRWRPHGWGGREFWLGEVLPTLAFAVAFPMQSYFRQDDGYNYPGELWLLFGLFGLTALALAAFYRRALHTSAARLLATVATFYALTIDFDERLGAAPGVLGVILPHAQLLSAVVIVLAAGYGLGRIVEWAGRHWHWWPKDRLAGMIRLVIAGIFLTNLYLLTGYMQKLSQATAFSPTDSIGHVTVKASAKRDVYYIVLDRYASAASLANYFGYDNSEFMQFLRDQGFMIRDDAYSNYQFTAPSISSTMRMDYHSDVQSALQSMTSNSYLPYRKILENSPVSRLFAQAGYQVVRMASWYGVTRTDNYGQSFNEQFSFTLFGHTFLMSDLQSAMIDHTVFAPWFRAGLSLGSFTLAHLSPHDTAQMVLDQLSDLREMSADGHSQPRFVFAHILSPHPPFVFTTSGSAPSYSMDDNNTGAPRELKYINQLRFLNSQVENTIKKIKASSKVQPVIIIQADEGPYPPEFADYNAGEGSKYPWEKASKSTLTEKYGTLAAYYLPDVPDDQKTKLNSSVNAFRFVFDNYFGANLPYLPDCSLLFDGKQPFKFYDVTAKLRGSEDARCPAYAAAGVLK